MICIQKEKEVQLSKFTNIDFRAIVKEIKEELEDHLTAINENTNEIQSNYEYLNELDQKMDKFSARLDQIQLFLQEHSSFTIEKEPIFEIQELTKKEKEVFLVLYTFEEQSKGATYSEIARKLMLSETLVGNYIMNMIGKGIPIIKTFINGKAHLKIDKDFKRFQAKTNVLSIEQKTLQTV